MVKWFKNNVVKIKNEIDSLYEWKHLKEPSLFLDILRKSIVFNDKETKNKISNFENKVIKN